jgi:hypothetical protein
MSSESKKRWKLKNPDYDRNYYLAHLEEKKQGFRQRYQKWRMEIFELLGGAVCVRCGCDDMRILEINHVNGNGNREYSYGRSTLPFYRSILDGTRNTEDLNVLCRICNALDFAERKCPELKGRFGVVWKSQSS